MLHVAASNRSPARLTEALETSRRLGTTGYVALRWLADQPTATAPIAGGRDVDQLADLLPMQDLVLTDDERAALDAASA